LPAGVIGQPLIPRLVQAGHVVGGLTRAKAEAQARVTFLNQSFEVLFAQQKPDSHSALQGIGKELEMSISKVNFNTSTKPFLALPGRHACPVSGGHR